MKKSDRRKADLLLHKFWTAAVGTKGYVKKEWQLLERAVNEVEDLELEPSNMAVALEEFGGQEPTLHIFVPCGPTIVGKALSTKQALIVGAWITELNALYQANEENEAVADDYIRAVAEALCKVAGKQVVEIL